jgi:hypothetical protein
MIIIGPIMFRAGEYGLLPGVVMDWTFTFTKS